MKHFFQIIAIVSTLFGNSAYVSDSMKQFQDSLEKITHESAASSTVAIVRGGKVFKTSSKQANDNTQSISEFTYGAFNKQIKEVAYDEHCPRRIIFEFDTQNSTNQNVVPQFLVRTSQLSDIDAMVLLSKTKRLGYEKAQPQFWRYAGEEGGLKNCWRTKII